MLSQMRTWASSYEPSPQGSSESASDAVETGASELSAVDEARCIANRDKWQDLIDHTLIDIGLNPQTMADPEEEILPPTALSVASAVRFARFARDEMFAPPGQTLPDGEGGLMIQHALPDGATESFEADSKGKCSIWFYPRAPQKPVQWEIEIVEEKSW